MNACGTYGDYHMVKYEKYKNINAYCCCKTSKVCDGNQSDCITPD